MDVANQSFTKQKINTNNAHAQAISNVEKASINRIGQRTALACASQKRFHKSVLLLCVCVTQTT